MTEKSTSQGHLDEIQSHYLLIPVEGAKTEWIKGNVISFFSLRIPDTRYLIRNYFCLDICLNTCLEPSLIIDKG